MKRWLRYMAVSAAVVALLSALIVLVTGRDVVAAVAVAAGIGLIVQALAAVLLFGTGSAADPSRFMVGWAGGALLRMMAVVATGLWLTRTEAVPEAAALLSLVMFLFVLTLIEPLFLKTAQ